MSWDLGLDRGWGEKGLGEDFRGGARAPSPRPDSYIPGTEGRHGCGWRTRTQGALHRHGMGWRPDRVGFTVPGKILDERKPSWGVSGKWITWSELCFKATVLLPWRRTKGAVRKQTFTVTQDETSLPFLQSLSNPFKQSLMHLEGMKWNLKIEPGDFYLIFFFFGKSMW